MNLSILFLPLATAALFLSGCGSLSYNRQAAKGQMQIFSAQAPNKTIIADPSADPDLKRQLWFIGELCRFAETELTLPPGKSYSRYADIGRDHVVWSVFAAPEFSLEPKRWWYPVVGSLSYRGYFIEQMARDEAAALQAQGYDVFVGEVDAYSTLGWFNDPVLNTFVHDSDLDLAELIFHELTHRRLYLSDETEINEALATAVAQEGVRRWLRSQGRSEALAQYETILQRRQKVYTLIDDARNRLEALYAQTGLFNDEMLARKTRILRQLESDYRGLSAAWKNGSSAPANKLFGNDGVNNAHLNAASTYHQLVPTFETLLAKCQGDLPAFFKAVKKRRFALPASP